MSIEGTKFVVQAEIVRPVYDGELIRDDKTDSFFDINNVRQNKFWAKVSPNGPAFMIATDDDGFKEAANALESVRKIHPLALTP